MSRELLIFAPDIKEMVWGKEYWTVSAHPKGDCIVTEGAHRGKRLSELWNKHRNLFGDLSGDRFPLLVKVLDTKEKLSVQVHPNDEYARTHDEEPHGKAECWYVMEAERNVSLILGHHAKTREEAEQLIREKNWKKFLKTTTMKHGNFIQLNPGTVHAIPGGVLLTEVQQCSDITYRLYDYDRMFHGQLRPLHLRKSLDVIQIPDGCNEHLYPSFPGEVYETDYYRISKQEIHGAAEFAQTDAFRVLSVVEGSCEVDGYPLSRGDSLVVPCGYGTYRITGNTVVLTSTV